MRNQSCFISVSFSLFYAVQLKCWICIRVSLPAVLLRAFLPVHLEQFQVEGDIVLSI